MGQLTATPLPELGDSLPPGTRFCFVRQDASTQGRLVAFVPCQRFEQNGWYLLSVGGTPQVLKCRDVQNSEEIEITSSDDKKAVRSEQFSEMVVGRVIGITLLAD